MLIIREGGIVRPLVAPLLSDNERRCVRVLCDPADQSLEEQSIVHRVRPTVSARDRSREPLGLPPTQNKGELLCQLNCLSVISHSRRPVMKYATCSAKSARSNRAR